MGYMGFYIDKFRYESMEFSKNVDKNKIDVIENREYRSIIYNIQLKNDKRDLYFIDIFQIPDIFEYSIEINKN
jgi:hypothetical protein